MVDEVAGREGREASFVAFAGAARIARGRLSEVAIEAKRALATGAREPVLVFDTETGHVRDLDLRGSEAEVLARYGSPKPAVPKRGRPKLGVVAREVTLLPRHWEWLASQPGGASVALRKLVETARKGSAEAAETRTRSEAAYRFMSAMAGDLPWFEDAARSLFAADWEHLRRCIDGWPEGIADQLLRQLHLKEEEDDRVSDAGP